MRDQRLHMGLLSDIFALQEDCQNLDRRVQA